MLKKNFFVLVMGESGSGKDTLSSLACSVPLYKHRTDEIPYYLKPLISYTTRPRRKGEHDTHHFTTPDKKPDPNTMLAYTKYHNYEYWATYDQLKDSDIYIIDPQGVENLRQHPSLLSKTPVVIYLQTSWWERFKRLSKRNSCWYAIKRIWNDRKAFSHAKDLAQFAFKQNTRTQLHKNCSTILSWFENPDVLNL